ncbi:hypothetical protein GE09DRAFT_201369 [Coniochaeta sp. 2T2.1]|nr:hypothetical protein GE09DRAFT_201369 [Coniochaeta sp. 2T2.1]
MSISPEYKLSDLRRTNIRSWLSTFVSLGQRVRDNAPPFATLIIGPPDQPNNIVDREVHVNSDTNDNRAQPHADLSHPRHTDAPPTSTPDTPDQLSAAIEVKCLVPVLKRGKPDNGFPSDRRPVLAASWDDTDPQSIIRQAHDSVASTIRHLSLASGSGATAPQPQSVTLHDIVAARRHERDFWATHWIVKKSNSAEPTEAELFRGDSYIWVPVEICSPKQRWNHSDGLETLLSSITNVLRALSAHHRVTTNYTCDVHVHVGRADGKPLHLVTLKRLATMLWLSEAILRSIRDPSSPNYTNIYTWGAELTRHSRLARSVDMTTVSNHLLTQVSHTLSDAALLDALRRQTCPIGTIWRAISHRELGQLLSGPAAKYRRLGFNFSSLGEEDERARTGPKTVEFRVLEGTLDEDVVAGWVRVCWGLVEIAGERVDNRYVGVVRACLADGIHAGRGNEGRDEEDKEDGVVKRRCGPESYIRVEGFRAMAVDGLGIRDRKHDAFIKALVKERHARR